MALDARGVGYLSILILGRYDAPALEKLFDEAGVLGAIRHKGFVRPHVRVEDAGSSLGHVRIYAEKDRATHLLFDACLTETAVERPYFALRGYDLPRAAKLAVIFWAREQNPTLRFSSDRPRLPLQNHPGLGILRRVFRAGVRMAQELDKDGLANFPKFPHDALMFFRSRLFLFLDGAEQGKLEALWRDLGSLGLRDTSLAIVGGCVRDELGRTVNWQPGLQVCTCGPLLTGYFHSASYPEHVAAAVGSTRYTVDGQCLANTVRLFERFSAEEMRQDDA